MKQTTPFLQAVLAIAAKDLRAELRSRQLVSAMALFGLMATAVFYFTLQDRTDLRVAVLPAVVWVTIVFAGTLGLNRNLAQEYDRGSFDGLLLAPIDRATLFYGKLIGAWLFSLVVAVVVSFALTILFNVTLLMPAWWLIIVLGTVGFSAVGTMLASMAVQGRGRETTLPIIILPVALPIIMAAVSASNAILAELPLSDWAIWLTMLASADIIFLVAPMFLFQFVVEE
jgi:heme exporter protein B